MGIAMPPACCPQAFAVILRVRPRPIDCLAQESSDAEKSECLIPLRDVLAQIEIGGIRLGDFAEVKTKSSRAP